MPRTSESQLEYPQIEYFSTRDDSNFVSFNEAVMNGQPDGGAYTYQEPTINSTKKV